MPRAEASGPPSIRFCRKLLRTTSSGSCIDVEQSSICVHLTDHQLRHFIHTVSWPSPTQNTAIAAGFIGRPTPRTVSKVAQDHDPTTKAPSEALALDIVFQHTTIPVPRVRRVIQEQTQTQIVMDYIPGCVLSDVWPDMPVWQRLRVIFTLRDYVRQLRAIRHPRSAVPGPPAQPGEPAWHCESPLSGSIIPWRGPFASSDKLSAFFNRRYRMVIQKEQAVDKAQAKERVRADSFDNSGPLVLTHQDITMRNIIVGDDGRLLLIDWSWAGFYPPWFEFVVIRIQSQQERSSLGPTDSLRLQTLLSS